MEYWDWTQTSNAKNEPKHKTSKKKYRNIIETYSTKKIFVGQVLSKKNIKIKKV